MISRKDWRRSGRRFIVRGLDHEGNAANFAETEHIFVQYLNGILYLSIDWEKKPNQIVLQKYSYEFSTISESFKKTNLKLILTNKV